LSPQDGAVIKRTAPEARGEQRDAAILRTKIGASSSALPDTDKLPCTDPLIRISSIRPVKVLQAPTCVFRIVMLGT